MRQAGQTWGAPPRSQALPGNARPGRLCLPKGREAEPRRAVRSQTGPGNEVRLTALIIQVVGTPFVPARVASPEPLTPARSMNTDSEVNSPPPGRGATA